MVRDGDLYTEPRYVTDAITDDAVAFLRDADLSVPFSLSVHYTAPHSPWDRANHPRELYDEYLHHGDFSSLPDEPPHPWATNYVRWEIAERRQEVLAGYFAATTAMDAGVGRIIAELDRRGLRESTLVIVTSDNGMNMGHHGVWGKGNGTFPMNMYDSSVQVPFIASLPGVIPQGRICHAMTSQYDFMPTVLDFLGIDHRVEPDMPGRSFAPALRGEDYGGQEQVVVFDEYGPVRMVRTTDWKYVHRYPYGPHELYDLINDPDESTNLYDFGMTRGAETDVASTHVRRTGELRRQMELWFERYSRPNVDGSRCNVTGEGQVDFCDTRRGGPQSFVGPVDVRLVRQS
jgi:arylsulfatase A-like enzyme